MRRREFIAGLGSAAAWPVVARAQQPAMPVVGFLYQRSSNEDNPHLAGFRQGLRENGYVEGQNIIVEYRGADRVKGLGALAAELVGLKVQVIVAAGTEAILAAKQASSSIPIVIAAASDPVGIGLVDSLARPGGNITGMSLASPDLVGKRLELLSEIVGRLSVVAVLWNPNDPPAALSLRETEAAAEALGVMLQTVEVRRPDDFESAFALAMKARASALIILTAPMMNVYSGEIANLALKYRLPGISYASEFSKAGGLISYGPSVEDLFRRSATYVRKLLKGEKPADLPIEQPTKFQLVINLKTAKALGLTIPSTLLVRADEVIE